MQLLPPGIANTSDTTHRSKKGREEARKESAAELNETVSNQTDVSSEERVAQYYQNVEEHIVHDDDDSNNEGIAVSRPTDVGPCG